MTDDPKKPASTASAPKKTEDKATQAARAEAAEIRLQQKTNKAADSYLKRKDSNSYEIDGDVN